MNKTLTITIDTPGRRSGLRPSHETELLQISKDGFSASCAVQDDGSVLLVVHRGTIVLRTKPDDGE